MSNPRTRRTAALAAATALLLAACTTQPTPEPSPQTTATTAVSTSTATPPASTTSERTTAPPASPISSTPASSRDTPPPTPSATISDPTTSAADDPGEPATVKSVHDGDTFTLTTGEKVRVLGIDTPEVPPAGNQCFGAEATEAATRILDGQQVELKADPQRGDKDRYGRLLRYVETDGGDFGEQMLKGGFGRVYEQYPVARTPLYREAQQAAKDNNVGLWKVCG